MRKEIVKGVVEKIKKEISELRLQCQTNRKLTIQLKRREEELEVILQLYIETKEISELTQSAKDLLLQVEEDSNKLRQLCSALQRYLNVSAVEFAAGEELSMILNFTDKLSQLYSDSDKVCTNALRIKEKL